MDVWVQSVSIKYIIERVETTQKLSRILNILLRELDVREIQLSIYIYIINFRFN